MALAHRAPHVVLAEVNIEASSVGKAGLKPLAIHGEDVHVGSNLGVSMMFALL